MTKIAVIGAGGHVFPLKLMNDFLTFPSMHDAQFVLMDIDPVTLARTARLTQRLVEARKLSTRIDTTVDLATALQHADVVITCFQVGGLEAYACDVEIPRRFGLDQTVGDTLGPGGVFRGLRTMKALETITEQMAWHCPDALLLNYTNPMSINCIFLSRQGISTVGLCHSVQHTAAELASILGAGPNEYSFKAAGINHQAWILEFRWNGNDVLDDLRAAINAYHRGEREPRTAFDEHYAGGREGVRTAIMNLVGYFPTESSHHASEYYPHFRRSAAMIETLLPQRWDYLEINRATTEEDQERRADGYLSAEPVPSEEYAAKIIDSILTNTPRTVYGNVPNSQLITNLPPAASVEVPILVDGAGSQPTVIGDLPTGCAAVNLSSIGLQLCTVDAYLERSRDLVYLAVSMDRLTSSLLDLDQIRTMVDEMVLAEQPWLPELR